MSTVIDQRVAELRFDNANFEKNVATSMSTLDKLKQKLNLTGASKGLEQVGTAARGITLNPLSTAVDQVKIKFSAATTIADQFFRNITNSAYNAGKQMLKSLTIDQLTSGWNKYNDKTSSVQTIMNATGKSIDEVNGYLQRLMDFSDETSYSFTEMTAGLATMVSSGGDINKLIPLITGVANATAFAGKGAAEFSRVLQYGVNQAYSLGYMQQQDWKTIEGATVNSKQLMQALIDAGEALGKIEKGQVTVSNFRSTLNKKWLDTEVMEQGFGAFSEFSQAVFDFMDGDLDGFSDEIKALYNPKAQYTASEVIEMLGDKYAELGVKAFKSAQEAKTFTEAIDATKDAVSSGWMKSYEIIFGNYQEAKELWTDLANFLWGVFAGGAERRNAILESVFGKDFLKPLEKVQSIFEKVKKPIDEVSESVSKVTKTLEDYQKVVQEVLKGNWGNGLARINALHGAGFSEDERRYIQNEVNKIKGSSVRHATNFDPNNLAKTSEGISEVTEETGKLVEELLKLDDTKLMERGLNKDDIKNLREIEKLAKKLGISVEELVTNADEIDGRWILIDSVKNFGKVIMDIFGAIKKAWDDLFGMSDEEAGQMLFDIIAALHRFSEAIQISDKTAEKITRTFKGLFALLDILLDLALIPLKLTFSLLGKTLKTGAGGVLEFTAVIGDNIVKFREWLEDNNVIVEGFKRLIEVIKEAIQKFSELEPVAKVITTIKDAFVKIKEVMTNVFGDWGKSIKDFSKQVVTGTLSIDDAAKKLASVIGGDLWKAIKSIPIKQWIKDFSELPFVSKAIDVCSSAFSKFKGILKSVFTGDWDTFAEYGKNIVDGLGSGLKNGISKVVDTITNLAKTLWTKFAAVLGIESPSKVFKWLGEMCIDGLMRGLKATSAGKIVVGMIELAKLVMNPFKNALGIHSPSRKFWEYGKACWDGFVLWFKENMPKVGAFFKNFGMEVLNLAKKVPWDKLIIIGLGVGAFIGINKTLQNVNKTCETIMRPLTDVTGAFKGMAKSISGFTDQLKEMAKAKKVEVYARSVLLVAIAIGVLVAAVIVVSKINPGKLWASIGAIAALAVIMLGLAWACDKLVSKVDFGTVATTLLSLGVVVLAMAASLKILSTIDTEKVPGVIEMLIAIMASLSILIAVMGIFVKGDVMGNINKVGTMLIKLSVALLLMVAVVKIAANLDSTTVKQGIGVLALIELLFIGIIAVTKCVGETDASKVGSMLLKMSLAMVVMVAVVKMASKLSKGEVNRGLAFVAAVELLFLAVIAVSKLAGEHGSKAGSLLLKMAAAMVLMVAVVKICAKLDKNEINKGLSVVVKFMGIIAVLVAVSKFSGAAADKAGQMLISVGLAMLIMTGVLIILKSLDPEGLGRATAVLAILGGICAGLIAVCGQVKDPEKMMKMLIVLAVIIAILAGTLITLSLLDKKKVAVAGAALSAVIGALALLVKAVSYINTNSKTWWRGLVVLGTLALVVAEISVIVLLLSKIKNWKSALAASTGISLILSSMAGSLFIISKSKTFTDNKLMGVLKSLAMMSGVLIILAVVLRYMDGIDGAHSIGNAIALSILLTVLSLLIDKLSLMDGRKTQKLPKIIFNIALLSGVMIVLSEIIKNMKDVDPIQGITSALVLSELIVVLAGVAIALSNFTKKSTNIYYAVGAIAILSGVMEQLADIIIKMDGIDAKKAIPNATALSELIAVLGGISIALSRFVKQSGKGNMYAATGAMAILSAVLYELADVLITMSSYDTDKAITNATALSILLAAMGGVVYAFSWLGKYIVGLYAGVFAMAILGAVLYELAGVLIMMSQFDTKNAIANATALSILLTFMAPVAAALTALGLFGPQMLAGIGCFAVLALVVGMLGTVLIKMKEVNPSQAIGVVVALGILMTVMIPVMVALMSIGGIVVATKGFGAAAIAAGFAVMVAVIAGMVAVAAAAGSLTEKYPSLQTFVGKGIELFKQLAKGLGEIVGSLVGGLMSGVMSTLPDFAITLDAFITNLSGFIDKVRPLGSDDSFKKGTKILIETLFLMLAAEFVNGILKTSGLGLFGSLVGLGSELSAFMQSIEGFIEGATKLDAKLLGGVKTLTEVILMLTAANFLDSLTKFAFFGGETDFNKFAVGLYELGSGINGFITQAGTLDDTHVATAANAAEIIKVLADAAKTIPNSGGLVGALVGENDLGTWAESLKTTAVGVVGFVTTLVDAGISEKSVKIAGHAADIISKLAQAASNIPNAGGLISEWLGDNELSKWSKTLPKVADGIIGFCKPFSEKGCNLTDDSVKLAGRAADIVVKLAEAADKVPNAGGKIAEWFGDNTLATFSESIPKLGTTVCEFINNLKDIDDTAITKAEVAAKVINAIAKIYKPAQDAEAFEDFSEIGNSVAEGVKAFVSKMLTIGSEQIEQARATLQAVIDIYQTAANTDVKTLKTFGESLKTIADDGIKAMIDALNAETPKTDATKAGTALIEAFIKGIKSKKSSAGDEAAKVAANASTKAGDKVTKGLFNTAGKNCVQGFINGLKDEDKMKKVTAAGTALGKAAYKAAMAALDEHSPSRKMYQVGEYAAIGFTNALFDNESTAYDAGTSVANYAKDGLTKAIAKVNSWFNDEITTQPTIRPVVDLSNVTSGAAAIDGMFGNRSVGLTANLNSINSRMNGIQNGGNDDVVDAINRLRKEINKVGGTNNYINGVNAGNDESVTDAINTIVGYARRDRRS